MKQKRFPSGFFLILSASIFFFSICRTFAVSPENDPSVKQKLDTTFIQSFKDELCLKVHCVNKRNSFALTDPSTSKSIAYAPNQRMNYGFGFNYKWMGLRIAFGLPVGTDDDKYGKTTRLDLQTNFYWRKFVLDINFQDYTGYYLKNSELLIPGFDTTGIYFSRRDIKTSYVGGSLLYLLNNKKFSYRASFLQNEKQLKSSGSPLWGSYIYVNSFHADSNLIIPQIEYLFTPGFNLSSCIFVNTGFSAGYAYSFVFCNNMYLSASLLSGISLLASDARDETGSKFRIGSAFSHRVQGRAALGYNGRKIYFGATAVADRFTVFGSGAKIRHEFGNLRFFIGYRFFSSR